MALQPLLSSFASQMARVGAVNAQVGSHASGMACPPNEMDV